MGLHDFVAAGDALWKSRAFTLAALLTVRPAILALMDLVIFLLLIVCANVANLLLVRESSRECEFAIRAAMGAERANIFAPIVGQGLPLSTFGTADSLIAALVLTRVMSTMMIVVKPTDPPTYVSITVAFFTISALACYLPARREARLDSMTARREQ